MSPQEAYKTVLVFIDNDSVEKRHEDEWYAPGFGLVRRVVEVRENTYNKFVSLRMRLVSIGK